MVQQLLNLKLEIMILSAFIERWIINSLSMVKPQLNNCSTLNLQAAIESLKLND